MIEPRAYLGVFWNPNSNNDYKYVGVLNIADNGVSELEIRETIDNQSFTRDMEYEVLVGVIGDDYPVSLFNVQLRRSQGTSSLSFSIKLVLAGQHITSLDTPLYEKCIISFPYLKNWVCASRTHLKFEDENESLVIDRTNLSTPIVAADLEQGLQLKIQEGIQTRHSPPLFYWEIRQDAKCVFLSTQEKSVNHYRQLIQEFQQFLSVALYCQQFPVEVILFGGNNKRGELVFPKEESITPRQNQLIQFAELQKKVPQMLINWHNQFQQVAPICRYLLQSLNDNSFDFPDFLIIAHALDGYHKRFVNKKDGKDIKKYKEQIDALLDRFKDIDVLKSNKIDTEVLQQSRNKYSHLIPDDDEKITKAVSGNELLDLTRKCKMLLTCCILDMLGLDADEINMCFNKSNMFPKTPSTFVNS